MDDTNAFPIVEEIELIHGEIERLNTEVVGLRSDYGLTINPILQLSDEHMPRYTFENDFLDDLIDALNARVQERLKEQAISNQDADMIKQLIEGT